MSKMFKDNLRDELNYQDITVKELSLKTGIPKPTLSCYLSSRNTMPPVDIAYKIAQALNVSMEYLVTGEASFNATKNQNIIPQNSIEGKISSLPIEKKKLIRDFITLLDDYELILEKS